MEEIIATVRAMDQAGANIGDLKIVARALQEMRDAFALFAPYRDTRKVATFGSARTQRDDAIFRTAENFARAIADAGFMVITGAGGGIMEACQRGAGRERSFGVNIELPFEQQANEVILGDPKLVGFNYFFTRKLFFLKEAHAVALFPGGFGTHDEGFEVLTLLQTGKCQLLPLVLLDQPRGTYWKTWHRYVQDHLLRRNMISPEDLSFYKVTDSVEEAVGEIMGFYRRLPLDALRGRTVGDPPERSVAGGGARCVVDGVCRHHHVRSDRALQRLPGGARRSQCDAPAARRVPFRSPQLRPAAHADRSHQRHDDPRADRVSGSARSVRHARPCRVAAPCARAPYTALYSLSRRCASSIFSLIGTSSGQVPVQGAGQVAHSDALRSSLAYIRMPSFSQP